MYKLILIFFGLIFLSGCNKSGEIIVDLSQEETEIELIPDYAGTSGCRLQFFGETDCDIEVFISSERSLKFKKGKIRLSKKYECYSGGKKLRVISKMCSDSSYLSIKYSYSSSYFGQK